MEKKEYTEPSMIVRVVNPYLMQTVSGPQPGDGEITDPEEELSKQNIGSGNDLEIRDVWED